jgi:hypothetical protein
VHRDSRNETEKRKRPAPGEAGRQRTVLGETGGANRNRTARHHLGGDVERAVQGKATAERKSAQPRGRLSAFCALRTLAPAKAVARRPSSARRGALPKLDGPHSTMQRDGRTVQGKAVRFRGGLGINFANVRRSVSWPVRPNDRNEEAAGSTDGSLQFPPSRINTANGTFSPASVNPEPASMVNGLSRT